MTYRLTITSAALFCMATLSNGTQVSAQQYNTGRYQAPRQMNPFTGLFSMFGYRGTSLRNNSINRYPTSGARVPQGDSASSRAAGQYCVHGNCMQCGCQGEFCKCGRDCPDHLQAKRSPQPVPQYRSPGPRFNDRYRDSSIQAPLPVSPEYRPTNYGTSVRWETDIRSAAARSRQTGRPMLVQVTAEWCGYCKKMKQETFTNGAIISDLNRSFVAVKLDADANRELVQQMKIESLPTTLVVTPDMKIVDRREGFQSSAQLGSILNRHMDRAGLEVDAQIVVR